MKKILMILIGLSTFLCADLIKSGNVVKDNTTGLEWQDTEENNSSIYSWQDAIDYCEVLTLDTYDDWRLPNINELKSKMNPAMKGDVFRYVKSDFYCSSTTSMFFTRGDAWRVKFDSGYEGRVGKNYYGHYVRCVRGGQ